MILIVAENFPQSYPLSFNTQFWAKFKFLWQRRQFQSWDLKDCKLKYETLPFKTKKDEKEMIFFAQNVTEILSK